MEEEIQKAPQHSATKTIYKNIASGALGGVVALVILAFVLMFLAAGAGFVFEVPLYLAFGWIFFLKNNLVRMNFGWEMILSSMIGWALCLWLTHAFCRWVAGQKNSSPWRFVQTLRLNTLVFLFFAASCALVGCVHQSIWLLSNPVVVNRSRNIDLTKNISSMKQLYLLLMDYESEHGKFPDSLQVLLDEGYAKSDEVFYAHEGKMREPFLYLGKGLSTSDNGGRVIVVSPFTHDGRIAYLRIDGSARSERIHEGKRGELQFQDLIQDGIWPPGEAK